METSWFLFKVGGKKMMFKLEGKKCKYLYKHALDRVPSLYLNFLFKIKIGFCFKVEVLSSIIFAKEKQVPLKCMILYDMTLH